MTSGGAIAGAIVGVFLFLLLILVVICRYKKYDLTKFKSFGCGTLPCLSIFRKTTTTKSDTQMEKDYCRKTTSTSKSETQMDNDYCSIDIDEKVSAQKTSASTAKPTEKTRDYVVMNPVSPSNPEPSAEAETEDVELYVTMETQQQQQDEKTEDNDIYVKPFN